MIYDFSLGVKGVIASLGVKGVRAECAACISFFQCFVIRPPVLCHFSDEVLNNSSERSEESVNVSKTQLSSIRNQMLPSSAWQRRHEVFHPYTFILLLTNLSLGFVLPYLWDGRPSSLGYMQLTTPRLVPMAVRMVMSVWITSFQMSRFSIVFWFWFMIRASSVTDFHPLATWGGIIFPTDIAKIQFCAPGCQEGGAFWRKINTMESHPSIPQRVEVQRDTWLSPSPSGKLEGATL